MYTFMSPEIFPCVFSPVSSISMYMYRVGDEEIFPCIFSAQVWRNRALVAHKHVDSLHFSIGR